MSVDRVLQMAKLSQILNDSASILLTSSTAIYVGGATKGAMLSLTRGADVVGRDVAYTPSLDKLIAIVLNQGAT